MSEASISLPSGWLTAQIGSVCDLINGDRGKNYPGRALRVRYGIPFISAGDIGDGVISGGEMGFISGDRFDLLRSGKVALGDIIYCIRGSLGKVAINSVFDRAAIASSLILLRPRAGIDSRYILYFLMSPFGKRQIQRFDNGTAQPNLSGADLARFDIPAVATATQRRIVAKIEELFSELDKGVESLIAAREQLRAYRQSLLKYAFEGKLTADWRAVNPCKIAEFLRSIGEVRMQAQHASKQNVAGHLTPDLSSTPVGWVTVPFSVVAKSIRNGISQKPSGSGSLKIFRISAVRPMEFDLTDWRLTDDEPEFSNYRLHKGDLVFTRYNGSRAYVGVAAVYYGDGSHVYPDKLIRCEILRELADPGYLAKAISCGKSRRFVESRIRTTAGQAGISGGDVREIPIPLCPPDEQILISSRLDAQLSEIGGLDREIEASLRTASLLRQSILKQAFCGKLVPQDPDDEPASVLLERIRAERARNADTKTRAKKATKGEAA